MALPEHPARRPKERKPAGAESDVLPAPIYDPRFSPRPEAQPLGGGLKTGRRLGSLLAGGLVGRVRLGRFLHVIGGLGVMPLSMVRMLSRLLVLVLLMVLSGLLVMLCRFLVVLRRFLVVLCRICHGVLYVR